MPADPEELVALMPFARQLGIAVDEASAERVVARLDWAPQLCTAGQARDRQRGQYRTRARDEDRIVAR